MVRRKSLGEKKKPESRSGRHGGGATVKNTHSNPSHRSKGKAEEVKSNERGGPSGPEPTRYGDWEYKGRCIDF